MMTLRLFTARPPDVPMSAVWYLSDLSEAKGRQDLFTRQSPQRLNALREHALIESAVSSNRIEGVEIDASRARAVVLGRPNLRDRNEEEVRGYRDALKLIHESARQLDISEKTVLHLHSLSRGRIGDAGQYKDKDIDIIETFPDGRGEKGEVVIDAIRRTAGDFSVADLQRECPGVSLDMIRHVLKRLRQTGEVECLGRGRNATWRSQPRNG